MAKTIKKGSTGVGFITKITKTFTSMVQFHFPESRVLVTITEVEPEMLDDVQFEVNKRQSITENGKKYKSTYPIDNSKTQLAIITKNY